MRRLTDAIITLILMAIIIQALLDMVRPYAPFIMLACVLMLAGLHIGKRAGYF